MKLLILSDTHRSLGFACEAIEKEAPDAVIHLGDHLGDAEDLSFAYQDPDFYYVPGNCDYAPTVPQMLTLEFDGVRIFATHGHLFGVKRELTALADAVPRDHRRRDAPEPRRSRAVRPQRLRRRHDQRRYVRMPPGNGYGVRL